ncbi:MAG: peptidoglycan-associated lipoprotein Pal [Bdellovibrionota bacterium]
MFLSKKHTIAALILGMSMGFVGCTDDEAAVEEPIEQSSGEEPLDPTPVEEPVPVETAAPIAPERIFFGFDDYTLSMESQDRLTTFAESLKAGGNSVVQIEGHCDERGSIEYNLALGEKRAQSVKNFLVNLGVDASRLTTISYGEEKPASEGHDESAWSQNRRAEFVISGQ